ncbi:MAG: 50S ribosomal protein L28 [Anaerolineae bacterium]|nr:50S ribosomal protein L28 [Anaerolineae bacterium]MBN8620680.1 50S ribosomal protein L28 [Anaerolineae bacterium]
MSGKHKITGTKPMFGNKRSHSLRATRRKWEPNLQSKRIYVPELDRYVRVTISVGELRTIDKIGLLAFLRKRGLSINSLINE